MFSCRRFNKYIVAGIIPFHTYEHDKVAKDSKTYQAYLQNQQTNETGLDRLKDMFSLNELGHVSAEVNSIMQSGILGFIVGMVYGGFNQSRIAYTNFIENNQATAFRTHFEAKKKLQTEFSLNFFKGGFKWGWRLALFTTLYTGVVTTISVYREKSSIFEYISAGTLTGALYKVNMGLKGMTSGGVVGGVLGTLAGSFSLLILHLTGNTMQEVRYWQYKWKSNRDDAAIKAIKNATENETPIPDMLKHHDEKTGQNITLETIK